MKKKVELCNKPGFFTHSALVGSCLVALAGPVSAGESLAEALSGGKASGQLRYRYEWVEQEAISEKARASTLRTQLGYLTGDYFDFNAFLQFEDVHVIGSERYNSTVNGLTTYPVVADPADTEVNQAYLSYKAPLNTTLRYGRQVITYDNHRFVGDVGWRQNQQTFDAFSVVSTVMPEMILSFAHVTNVNRIFSEKHPTLSDVRMQGELINLAYKGIKAGTLVGYGYLLDYAPGQSLPITTSNKTLGLRFDGGTTIDSGKLLYTAEYAQQSDYKDGASTVDADYLYGMFGMDVTGIQFKFHYEVLSGDGVYALQTPLATLHAHNGWADKFLTTPTDGLVDRFITVGTAFGPVNLLAAYHDYVSDNLDYDYGSELNFSAAWKAAKQLTLLFKYASYDGDGNTTVVARNVLLSRDIDKIWLQADWQF